MREIIIPLRVIDRKGYPVLGLGPEDLEVTIGGEPVPVRSLVWHASEPFPGSDDEDAAETGSGLSLGPEELGPAASLRRRDARSVVDEDGRLVVLFVQVGHHQVTSLEEAYIGGHLKLRPYVEDLLAKMPPNDRVALVSFDARLKLWEDFTLDHEAVGERIYDAIGFGEPDPVPAEDGPSLFERFDFEAAEDTAEPEEALQIVAEAVEHFPGIKEIVFMGWGIGRYVEGFGIVTPPSQIRATTALRKARAVVHVLDVMQGSHALASGLKTIAASTGGTYASTDRWPRREVARLGRILRGHYYLVLDPAELPEDAGKLRVELAGHLLEGDAVPRPREIRLHHSPLVLGGPQGARSR